jgi:hypothetical protein
MKEIKIAPPVTLPSLSTDLPEKEYNFLSFILEFMLMNKRMREDSNLQSLFALEEEVSKIKEGQDTFILEEKVWEDCKKAAKADIDERMSQNATNPLPLPWAMKVLRHYHVFATASNINEN